MIVSVIVDSFEKVPGPNGGDIIVNVVYEEGWSPFSLLWRNGLDYLRVDGHCDYYAYGSGRNEPIATGRLTGEEASALAGATRYSE